MKFILKASLENPQELARFIQNMDVEIDMPFLKNSSDETIKELCDKLCLADDFIEKLKDQIQYMENEHKKLMSEQTPIQNQGEVFVDKKQIKVHKSPFANLKPISCLTCGLEFIPHHNKVKWCPECKAAKTTSSKKVMKLQQTPG